MDYFYKVKLTGGRVAHLRELNLEQYKNLQKICIESDFDNFKVYVNSMIDELVVGDGICDVTLLDVYIIILNIRKYSVSDEKPFVTHTNGVRATEIVSIDALIDAVYGVYEDLTASEYEMPIEGFIADTVTLNPLDCTCPIVSFKRGTEVYKWSKEIDDILPISIASKITEYVNEINLIYNDITLFTLYRADGSLNCVKFNLSDDFIYTFLRVILKDDLRVLYKNIYDVKRHLNISFDEHPHLTFSEMEMYISMFNKEQEEVKDKQQDDKFPNVNM